jgi:hypothetical protein
MSAMALETAAVRAAWVSCAGLTLALLLMLFVVLVRQ